MCRLFGMTGGSRPLRATFWLLEAHSGDVGAAIGAAARWVAETLPIYSLNCVLATSLELWGFRYPDTHRLMVLERAIGGPTGARHLDAASPAGTVRVRSGSLGK